MLQTGGHDLFEYQDSNGFSKRWEPSYDGELPSQHSPPAFGVVQAGDTPTPRFGVKYQYNWVMTALRVRAHESLTRILQPC